MVTLSFKVTVEEAREIRRNARRERVTVSEYLRRRAALPDVGADRPRLVRCPKTGAMVFESSERLPPLTVESTREMLTDFP